MAEWALIRFHGDLYRLRHGQNDKEQKIVAELIDGNSELHPAYTMTQAANQRFKELEHKYIPHQCAARARLLVKHIGAEFVDWSNPSNTPEAPDEADRIY